MPRNQATAPVSAPRPGDIEIFLSYWPAGNTITPIELAATPIAFSGDSEHRFWLIVNT